jgi:hypothetical protein
VLSICSEQMKTNLIFATTRTIRQLSILWPPSPLVCKKIDVYFKTRHFKTSLKYEIIHKKCIQWNSVITNSVVNEQSVTTSKILSTIVFLLHKVTRLKRSPVITNKNGQSRAVRYNQVSLYIKPNLLSNTTVFFRNIIWMVFYNSRA